ncbi:MAG: peptide ABC transporter permease, partial [Deltaproteobacteria bacterium 37-65-8]
MSGSRDIGRDFARRLLRNRLAAAGGLVVVFFFLVAAFPALFTSQNPDRIDVANILRPPSAAHPLGTDDLGRDVLARVVYGARVSMKVGFVAVGIATAIGLVLGLLAGFHGGRVDAVLMRFVDIMLCFPTF